jgi:hypothetical protein
MEANTPARNPNAPRSSRAQSTAGELVMYFSNPTSSGNSFAVFSHGFAPCPSRLQIGLRRTGLPTTDWDSKQNGTVFLSSGQESRAAKHGRRRLVVAKRSRHGT